MFNLMLLSQPSSCSERIVVNFSSQVKAFLEFCKQHHIALFQTISLTLKRSLADLQLLSYNPNCSVLIICKEPENSAWEQWRECSPSSKPVSYICPTYFSGSWWGWMETWAFGTQRVCPEMPAPLLTQNETMRKSLTLCDSSFPYLWNRTLINKDLPSLPERMGFWTVRVGEFGFREIKTL